MCESHLHVGWSSPTFSLLTLHPVHEKLCGAGSIWICHGPAEKRHLHSAPPSHLLIPCSLLGPLSHSDLPLHLDAPVPLYQI